MEMNQIRYFLAVCEHRNFTHAARASNVSQPSLTAAIKRRETREAKAEAIRHVRLDRVPIAVGVGETVGQGRISEAVERYRLRRPEAEIELIVDARDALLEGLRDGRFSSAGWCVYPPGSAHHPTVTGGGAHVLYLLPEGRSSLPGPRGGLYSPARVLSAVITGLDPVIHGAAARWMPGSSPGMTAWGWGEAERPW